MIKASLTCSVAKTLLYIVCAKVKQLLLMHLIVLNNIVIGHKSHFKLNQKCQLVVNLFQMVAKCFTSELANKHIRILNCHKT